MERKWSVTQNLKETVKNPNIMIKGTHSYYSHAWGGGFEDDCVRYLYGDEHSLKNWTPQWKNRQTLYRRLCVHRGGERYFDGRKQHAPHGLVQLLLVCGPNCPRL